MQQGRRAKGLQGRKGKWKRCSRRSVKARKANGNAGKDKRRRNTEAERQRGRKRGRKKEKSISKTKGQKVFHRGKRIKKEEPRVKMG